MILRHWIIAKQQILTGKNGVFDGAIETNTGEIIGTAGSTLDDATITGAMNWYFKTVNVVEWFIVYKDKLKWGDLIWVLERKYY